MGAHYLHVVPAFDAAAYNTPAPAWTKERIGRGSVNNIKRLADYICTRTPPGAFGNVTDLYREIVKRNQSALGSWIYGYELLTRHVERRLIRRDGRL